MSAKIHVHRNTFWTWKLHFSTKQKIYVKTNIALKSNNAGKSQPNKSFDNFFLCIYFFSESDLNTTWAAAAQEEWRDRDQETTTVLIQPVSSMKLISNLSALV